MPSSTEQDEKAGTLLTNAEVARLRTIIQDKTFPETRALADKLQLKDADGEPLEEDEQAELKHTRADIDYFFDTLPDGTIQAGEDYSNPRDKEDVRRTLRLRLGLPAVSAVVAEQVGAAAAAGKRRRCTESVSTRTVSN